MPKKTIPDDLAVKYKRLADVANRRLRRIEKEYSKDPAYKEMKQFAYSKAKLNIKKLFGPNVKGFSRRIPTGKGSYRKFQQMYNAVQDFLHSKSSTLKELKQTYSKRANTMNNKYNWNMKWTDLAKMFESGMYKKFKAKGYSSDTTFRAIALIKNSDKQILDEKYRVKMIGTDVDPVLLKVVDSFVRENGKDVKSFLKKI